MLRHHIEAPLVVAETCLRVTLDGNDPLGSQDLHALICIVHGGHELGQSWSSQDGVVRHLKVDHVEHNLLCPKVFMLLKGNEEQYLADEALSGRNPSNKCLDDVIIVYLGDDVLGVAKAAYELA